MAQGAETVQVTFAVFANGLPNGVMYIPDPNEKPVTLQFFSSDRSREYQYTGSNPLVFFREVEGPPDPLRSNAPRIQRVPVGYVSVPGGMRNAFFLFTPDGIWGPNTIPRFNVSVFDDGLRSFPAGHAIILNATGRTLFGKIGETEIGIGPGMSPPVQIDAEEFTVDVFGYEDGEATQVYFDRVLLGASQRVTILLLPSNRSGKPRVQRCLLYDPPGKPEQKLPSRTEGGK